MTLSVVQLSAIAEGFEEKMKESETADGLKKVYFESMTELYLKYIDPEAPLEINIGSRQRKKLQFVFAQKWEDSECKELMSLMESAAEEIVKLMTEAAIRYSSLNRIERRSVTI